MRICSAFFSFVFSLSASAVTAYIRRNAYPPPARCKALRTVSSALSAAAVVGLSLFLVFSEGTVARQAGNRRQGCDGSVHRRT